MSDSEIKSNTATLEPAPEDTQRAAAPERRRMTLNMGPQHPSTHGVLRVLLELDGETVISAYPDIGFLHTGIEKQCEALTWQQVVPLTDRVDYLNNMGNNLVYALAVEKLLNVTDEMPESVKMMRVLLAELQRINSHCVWLGTSALDLGAMTVFFYCFREREDILRLFEMLSGQRMMTSYIRPGGLALEPPRGWFKSARKFIDAFSDKVDEYESLLAKNPIWLERTKDVGFVSLDELLGWGVTGPMIRAAGLPWDIRKDEPYSGYEKYDFQVATRTENDVWARYRVRIQEMRESTKIVKQALDGISADGPWQLDIPRVTLPGREKMKTQMEALIHHFKIVTEGMRVPPGEAYQAVESPRGEIAYYVVSDGSSHPHRVFMRTPSFGNLQVLPPMVEGKLIADTIASMGSMDFVLGDVDR
jgi:NADH-quinone oxidoreductase subunit D